MERRGFLKVLSVLQFGWPSKAGHDLPVKAVEQATGISWDGTSTPWVENSGNKLYLQSGQFSSTLQSSACVTTDQIRWEGMFNFSAMSEN